MQNRSISANLLLVLFATLFAPGAHAQSAQLPPPKGAVTHFNPMRAAHDLEVGKFYLRRGDTYAAIARFKDAILYKPNYAEPRLLLGQIYEKKNDPQQAIRYYREYLKILPNTPEAQKVRERVAKLEKDLPKEDRSKSAAKKPSSEPR